MPQRRPVDWLSKPYICFANHTHTNIMNHQDEHLYRGCGIHCLQKDADFLLSNYAKEDLHKDLDELIFAEMNLTFEDKELLDKEMAQRRLHLYFFMKKTLRSLRYSKEHRKTSDN